MRSVNAGSPALIASSVRAGSLGILAGEAATLDMAVMIGPRCPERTVSTGMLARSRRETDRGSRHAGPMTAPPTATQSGRDEFALRLLKGSAKKSYEPIVDID